MTNASVGVHGPIGAGENCPRGELELRVSVIGAWAAWTAPIAFSRPSVIGPDGWPAGNVCGAVVNVSSGCVHVRNDFQSSVNDPPG